MNNNPMRDVIEQMKANAQREGKQQTSPVLKAAMEKLRLRERLDMARNSVGTAAQSLIDAEVWANDKSTAEQVLAMCRKAQELQRQIEVLLRHTGDEQ